MEREGERPVDDVEVLDVRGAHLPLEALHLHTPVEQGGVWDRGESRAREIESIERDRGRWRGKEMVREGERPVDDVQVLHIRSAHLAPEALHFDKPVDPSVPAPHGHEPMGHHGAPLI